MRPYFIIAALAALCAALSACARPASLLDDGRKKPPSITVQGMEVPGPDPNYTAARELRLKVRELADQLVAEIRDPSLAGTVALPVSFVNLDDFGETSAFGRLLGEQIYFEFNQRGFPVREYRIENSVRVKKKEGEFILSRRRGSVPAQSSLAVVGTYAKGPGAVFVNARLVRPSNGRVLRTASMVFEANETVNSLLHRGVSKGETAVRRIGAGGAGASVEGAGGTQTAMRISDFDAAVRPSDPLPLTPFDRGEDVH
ncbi:MAG: hypothetical protein LBU06_06660 [Desulfovibrio sp.]|jgi:hypothetical protein|nr:hypothetical protein [Desulfovibrio sp.]